jgi:hypothetical protein
MPELDSVLVDELPVQSLPKHYGVARSQVFNRIKALGIETIKRKQKAYVNADHLAVLDQLHDLLQQDYSLESAVMLILGDRPQQQNIVHVPQGVVEQAHGTAGQLEIMQMLMAAIAHQQPAAAPPAPANPLSRFEQLQAIADNDWRPSTSELAAILGLNSLSGSSFERYGFRFTRSGKNGAQSAWKVEKCVTKAKSQELSPGDMVKLKDPYQGRYGYGVVVEVISHTRYGHPRNVSLHLYYDEGQLYIKPLYVAKGLMVPNYVDFHVSELVWYRRASDQGYHTIPNPSDWSAERYLA